MSQRQFASRLRALLPTGWFPGTSSESEVEQAPILNGMLQGIASVFSWTWGQLQDAYDQQRLATATGGMLEIYADDFFGDSLPRHPAEQDDDYRTRIKTSLFPTLGTRPSLERALTSSWNAGWRITEPRNASDTKGYGSVTNAGAGGGYGYETTELRYGTLLSPFQAFISLQQTLTFNPPQIVLSSIESVRAGGMVMWVGGNASLTDFGADIL
ncbi:hypothetical protein [Asaia bogorensis]|uniref:hypothetical protein n=1 Tax=Asaia bogorensis TaxID=91915 RepID=UPI0013CE97D8|nr:hypothetical protein [Asaia bogorensis]